MSGRRDAGDSFITADSPRFALVLILLLGTRAMRWALGIGFTLALIVGICAFHLRRLALDTGLEPRDLDLDGNGRVSLGEIFYSADLDTRQVVVDGRPCTEIYRLKDGLRAKLDCAPR